MDYTEPQEGKSEGKGLSLSPEDDTASFCETLASTD